MGKSGAFLQCHLTQVSWKGMLGQSYISPFLNHPNTWGKSLQFWKQQVGNQENHRRRERERNRSPRGTVAVPLPNAVPDAPLPSLASASLFFPLPPTRFSCFHPRSFCPSSLFTTWLDKLYDILAAGHRVFPEESPLFRKPCLIPSKGKMTEKGGGREHDDGKFKQLTKAWRLKQISVHKSRNANCIQFILAMKTFLCLCPSLDVSNTPAQFLRMRTLFMVIAYDPSAVSFLRLILQKKKKQISKLKAYIVW